MRRHQACCNSALTVLPGAAPRGSNHHLFPPPRDEMGDPQCETNDRAYREDCSRVAGVPTEEPTQHFHAELPQLESGWPTAGFRPVEPPWRWDLSTEAGLFGCPCLRTPCEMAAWSLARAADLAAQVAASGTIRRSGSYGPSPAISLAVFRNARRGVHSFHSPVPGAIWLLAKSSPTTRPGSDRFTHGTNGRNRAG